jgi:hypothetical protein
MQLLKGWSFEGPFILVQTVFRQYVDMSRKHCSTFILSVLQDASPIEIDQHLSALLER